MVHIQIESNQYWYFYLTILAGSRPAEHMNFLARLAEIALQFVGELTIKI